MRLGLFIMHKFAESYLSIVRIFISLIDKARGDMI